LQTNPVERQPLANGRPVVQRRQLAPDEDDEPAFESVEEYSDEEESTSMKDFIVDDDEVEEVNGFEPQKHKISLDDGPPQSSYERLGSFLPDNDAISSFGISTDMFLDNFVANASDVCRELMQEYNLRKQPFSDSQLRQMGLTLPTTVTEIKAIKGVDANMADKYGAKVLELVKTFKQSMTEMTGSASVASGSANRIRSTYKPFDPNREEVIVLEDDEDEDRDDSFMDLNKPPDSSPGVGFEERSHFFRHSEVDPRVEAFNRMIDQEQHSREGRKPPSIPMTQQSRPGPQGFNRPYKRRQTPKNSTRKASGGSDRAPRGSRSRSRNPRSKGSTGKRPATAKGGIGMMPL
jgi:bloom syndrome protein